MLASARFHNFTTVPNATFQFAGGLNVIVGENGTGKSHILKALYSMLKVQAEPDLSRTTLERAYALKLTGVLRPESLGRLVKRKQGRDRCEIEIRFKSKSQRSEIAFATNAESQVKLVQAPATPIPKSPVYLPTRELMTLSPWFLPLYDNYHVEFEESWRDTVSLLGSPSIRGPRERKVAQLLEPLEKAMGGKVIVNVQTGRAYLKLPSGQMEMPLVAEGLRKVAMLARLISTGVLLDQGYLFWDEPETNLNPRLIKTIAACIAHLAASGIQVFIATHSLFLLREIEMIANATQGMPCRYFALAYHDGEVVIEQSATLEDIQTLVLLDEELLQSDRYMEST